MTACARCGESKPRERFSPNPRMGDGLSSWCRDCASAATREWRARTPAYAKGYNAGRRVAHPTIACEGCGLRFRAPRRDSRFCCGACRDALRVNGHPKVGQWAELHHRMHEVREGRGSDRVIPDGALHPLAGMHPHDGRKSP